MQIAAFLSLLRCPCACALLYMPLFSLAVLRSMALCLCRLLDTAAVCAAVSCAALAVSVWLCILYRFIMCYIDAAALAPPLSPCLQRTRQRLILPYKIRWFIAIKMTQADRLRFFIFGL